MAIFILHVFIKRKQTRTHELLNIGLASKSTKSYELELVFIKHYAPNICLPQNMAEIAVS